MYKNIILRLLLVITAVAITGCATSSRQRKFKEARQANVIIEFNSWDYTYLTKPPIMDGVYRREVSTNDMATVLTENRVGRDLAVVQLGWMYSPENLADALGRWTEVMNDLKFRRVVYVAANGRKSVNGSRIIRDTQSADNPPLEDFLFTKPDMGRGSYTSVMRPMMNVFGN